MTSSCLKLNNLLNILVKDSCIIFILFLCYIQQLLAVLHHFMNLHALKRAFFYAPRPLIDGASRPSRIPYDALPYLRHITYIYIKPRGRDGGTTGHKNVALSRNHLSDLILFLSFLPQANHAPSQLPDQWIDMLLIQRCNWASPDWMNWIKTFL